jgi:hypothetical protein
MDAFAHSGVPQTLTGVSAPPHERLDRMTKAFGFAEHERNLAALLFGSWLRPEGCVRLTAATAASVLGVSGGAPRASLLVWDLIREVPLGPGEPVALSIDETVADWLCGGDPLPPALRERVELRAAREVPRDWPVEKTAEMVRRAMGAPGHGPVVIEIEGVEGAGRRSFAAALGACLGAEPLIADARGLTPAEWHAAARAIERAALLLFRPVAWLGAAGLVAPAGRPAFPVQLELRLPGEERILREVKSRERVCIGSLRPEERHRFWRLLAPCSEGWGEDALGRLVRTKPATIGDIARACARAPGTPDEALDAMRGEQRAHLDPAIRPLAAELTWDDLVLPERATAALARFAEEARLREGLWQEPRLARLFPQDRGVLALFNGPSGTGKTMAAQIIAAELGLDLYVVDTGAIVSKYVGETAQNLQRVLAGAQADAAILFFDEADGLFGKRTDLRDAHDRYVNADTNVLLQAVSDFGGVAILATNRRDNIDTAFLRRLRYLIEFPRPDSGLRRTLWRKLISEMAGASAMKVLEPTLSTMADVVELTGAQVKNALLTAVLEARAAGRGAPSLEDLLTGVDQELMKEGRALSRREMERVRKHAKG